MQTASPDNPIKRFELKKKSNKGGPLVMSVFTMIGVLLLGTIVVVSVASFKPEPEFIAKKTIYLPQRELDHKMAVSEFQQAASSPTTVEKLNAETLLSDVPALPQLPTSDFTPVENDSPIGDAQSMFGNSGLMGAMQGLTSKASSVSFLGIQDDARKILLVFDVSKSVINSINASGMTIEDIKRETVDLIGKLNANTLFGILQHSRTPYKLFQPYMIPATVENKALAVQWVNQEINDSGSVARGVSLGTNNGIEGVMEVGFKLEPDSIFMLSDAGYFRGSGSSSEPVPYEDLNRLIHDLQKQMVSPARIHFIHFVDERDIQDGRIGKDMRRIANNNKGHYRAITSKP